MYNGRFPGPHSTAAQNNSGLKLDRDQALGILNHLNQTELQELLDNESKLEQLVTDNQQIKALDADKVTLVASNKSLSEYNLSLEPRLTQGKERLSTLYQNAQELYQQVSEKKLRADNNVSGTSLEEALALLKSAADSLENETDALSDKFLANDINIDSFLDSYIEKRTLAHNRKIKAEKMSEMVRSRSSSASQLAPSTAAASAWPGSVPAPYAQPSRYGPALYGQSAHVGPYGLPYGAGPVHMPSQQAYLPR